MLVPFTVAHTSGDGWEVLLQPANGNRNTAASKTLAVRDETSRHIVTDQGRKWTADYREGGPSVPAGRLGQVRSLLRIPSLFCQDRQLNSFLFNELRTLCKNTGGAAGGVAGKTF